MTAEEARKYGLIDKIILIWSENVDTDDGVAPIATDFGIIVLPHVNFKYLWLLTTREKKLKKYYCIMN